jgi:hypothetical protein
MPRGNRTNFEMTSNVIRKIRQNDMTEKTEGCEVLRQSAMRKRRAVAYRALRRHRFVKVPIWHRLDGNVCLWIFLVCGGLSVANATANCQTVTSPSATKDATASPILSVPARSWTVDASANELIALHHKDSYLRYRMHLHNEKGDQVRDVIESKDGTVARLILRDGKPLTEEEDHAERQRLSDMITSPSAFARHVRNGDSEKKLADRLVPLMPDAMIYDYAPGQPQTSQNDGVVEIVLDFKPNPKFSPPNTEAEALTGLQGRVWIDSKTRHLVRMEGTIFRPVNFGWGMLAHIYPGGKLALEQTNAGDGRWIFTRFSMRLSARALMVKTVNVNSTVEAGSFQTLGPIAYQDAIRMLLDTPLAAH